MQKDRHLTACRQQTCIACISQPIQRLKQALHLPAILDSLPFLLPSTHIATDHIERPIAGAVIHPPPPLLAIWQRLTAQARQRRENKIAPIIGAKNNAKAWAYLHR